MARVVRVEQTARAAIRSAVVKLDRAVELTGLFHEVEQLMQRLRDRLPVLEQAGTITITLAGDKFMLTTDKRCYVNKGTF